MCEDRTRPLYRSNGRYTRSNTVTGDGRPWSGRKIRGRYPRRRSTSPERNASCTADTLFLHASTGSPKMPEANRPERNSSEMRRPCRTWRCGLDAASYRFGCRCRHNTWFQTWLTAHTPSTARGSTGYRRDATRLDSPRLCLPGNTRHILDSTSSHALPSSASAIA